MSEEVCVKFCEHCNNEGKVWIHSLGNWVPCETENDCAMGGEDAQK